MGKLIVPDLDGAEFVPVVLAAATPEMAADSQIEIAMDQVTLRLGAQITAPRIAGIFTH